LSATACITLQAGLVINFLGRCVPPSDIERPTKLIIEPVKKGQARTVSSPLVSAAEVRWR